MPENSTIPDGVELLPVPLMCWAIHRGEAWPGWVVADLPAERTALIAIKHEDGTYHHYLFAVHAILPRIDATWDEIREVAIHVA